MIINQTGVQIAMPIAAGNGADVRQVTVPPAHAATQALDEGATLRDSEERFRTLAQVVPAFLFTTTADLGWDYVNPRFYAFTGMAEGSALGGGWMAVVHGDDLAENQRRWQTAVRQRAPFEQEFRIRAATPTDAAAPPQRWHWFLVRAMPRVDAQGEVVGWCGSCTDIQERRVAEAYQRLLHAELQHRVRNILAVVRSVVTRTLETNRRSEDLAGHLSGRIGALARMHGVIARSGQPLVPLEELVLEELASHGGHDESLHAVDGPTVLLPDKVAELLGLALHELATNALKFGALGVPRGRVSVSWRIGPDAGMAEQRPEGRRLVLEWQESGVPLTDLSPAHVGFGRALLEEGLAYELGATTTLTFRPGGIACVIDLLLAEPSAGPLRPEFL